MMRKLNSVFSYIIVVLIALLLAINYHIFIVENHFAPAGLNGIATMIQYKTGFSISYMSLIINIPLCIMAYFLVEKRYAIKTFVFTIAYSFFYLLLQNFDFDFLKYNANGHDTVFPAIISGVISGFVCGIGLKNGFATGGMEIVSKYINKVHPEKNFFFVTFTMNAFIAFVSLFVFSDAGFLDYKPVALCITYCFITNFIGNYIIRGTKLAYKFTVITTHPDEIIDEITHILKRGATKVDALGAYTNSSKTVLLCVVDKHQIIDFKEIIDKYDNTFSFCEMITETYGNFKRIKG